MQPGTTPPVTLHGLDLSYFTGKLEAYLRAKGIAYALREMTTRSFRACGRATGFLQMPQVEMPDGTWLTDTTLIMRHFEAAHPGPALLPVDPVARVVALLIEDFGDEALWRPALHYRWSFADDARLMSARLARGMLRDVPLPFFLRRQLILRRQQWVYLRQDGVTSATRPAIERLYADTLAAMEQALATRPFVMGERPCTADFGLFGAMFRHFASDPTPAALMRTHAPLTAAWVARVWALTPERVARGAAIQDVPETAAPLLRLCASVHLPELAAHDAALTRGASTATFTYLGAAFSVPPSPYRAWCLDELRKAWQALPAEGQERVAMLLGEPAARSILAAPRSPVTFVPPGLPLRAGGSGNLRDRNGL